MDKKTIILVAILVVLVVVWFPALEYLGLAQKPAPTEPVKDSTSVDTSTPIAAETSTVTEAGVPVETPVAGLAEMADTASVDTLVVRTNTFVATLVSKGGGPIGLQLRKYFYRDGEPIEMLGAAAEATPEISFASGAFSASRVHYECNLRPGEYDATRSPLEVTYTFHGPQGGMIAKTYTFRPDDYDFGMMVTVEDPTRMGFERRYDIIWNTPLTPTEPQLSSDYSEMIAVAMQSGSRQQLDDFDNGKLNQSLDGSTEWAGVREKYFAAVIIPRTRQADSWFAKGTRSKIHMSEEGEVEHREVIAGMSMPFASVQSVTDSFVVFVGPMDYSLMSHYDVGLEDILGIGTTPFVGWIIKPFALGIIWLLPKMYSVLPNYGLVIIIFALLVKIITLPLSLKSFKSMNAMRELGPKMEELKKKYKNNPQQLNQETMALYKKHGVNPISGCLPILPQMPLFFALFSVFRATILLRDAPFVWFIDDLSRGASSFTDPYIALVILMILAQFVSQKFTMASATQQNKALMYMMPLIMGFLFYQFSSGLVLYWTCFSVFSLLDYVLFKQGILTGGSSGTEVKPA